MLNIGQKTISESIGLSGFGTNRRRALVKICKACHDEEDDGLSERWHAAGIE